VVPNLRIIGLCDRGTLRWVRLCLTTPIHEMIHPDWLGRVKIQEPPELRTEYLEYLERAKVAMI